MSITINPQTINSPTRAASTPTSSTSTATATGGQTLGEQTFLKLLTTELSNQNPMDTSNQDPTQMVAQLAQFSEVEGINNLQTSQLDMQGSAMLGHTASATTTSASQVQSTVSGTVSAVNYTSGGVTVSITDSTGAVTSGIPLSQVQSVSN